LVSRIDVDTSNMFLLIAFSKFIFPRFRPTRATKRNKQDKNMKFHEEKTMHSKHSHILLLPLLVRICLCLRYFICNILMFTHKYVYFTNLDFSSLIVH
jgi:hypothetical protein